MYSPCRIAIGLLVVTISATAASAQGDDVGSIEFPTSTHSAEAQQHFLRGVAILHSFGFEQALAEFQAAQEFDPDFAMAYWGETLSYNHPLFGGPIPDDASPRAALKRLGATPEARAGKAPTDREKGFLAAVEALWSEDGSYDERRVAYMEAMRRLYDRYPDDDEIATFRALSMLAGARALGDQSLRLELQAGAITLGVFGKNPDHPGAPHYTIHSFDDPLHAPLALPAARRYAQIAPAVSHARHMPTHIFIQHGMWDLVSEHNQSAYEAARALWTPGASVGDTVHSLDWGQYGDLQFGDYAKARTWIERLDQLIAESDGDGRAVGALPILKARYVVETEEWHTAPITDDSSAHELLATGLSAVRTGDLATAREAEAALAKRAANGDAQERIAHKEMAALVHATQGQADMAVATMDEALEIVAGLRPPRGPASPVKEQLTICSIFASHPASLLILSATSCTGALRSVVICATSSANGESDGNSVASSIMAFTSASVIGLTGAFSGCPEVKSLTIFRQRKGHNSTIRRSLSETRRRSSYPFHRYNLSSRPVRTSSVGQWRDA